MKEGNLMTFDAAEEHMRDFYKSVGEQIPHHIKDKDDPLVGMLDLHVFVHKNSLPAMVGMTGTFSIDAFISIARQVICALLEQCYTVKRRKPGWTADRTALELVCVLEHITDTMYSAIARGLFEEKYQENKDA